MNQYEGMFLFDAALASDFSKAQDEIKRILDRAGATIKFCEKWDERKLAYEIKGRKRGCYVLTYFDGEPDKVTGIERDASLSELVLRILVRRADDITPEQMAANLPNAKAASGGDGEEGSRSEESRPAAGEGEKPAAAKGETKQPAAVGDTAADETSA